MFIHIVSFDLFMFYFLILSFSLSDLQNYLIIMNSTDDEYWNEKSFEGFSFADEV